MKALSYLSNFRPRTAMPSAISLQTTSIKFWRSSVARSSPQPCRHLAITCRGEPISRDELFKYTNGRFLVNETSACDRRYVRFDVEHLCEVAASAGEQYSPVNAIEKLEGGFSKALLLRKDDGNEVVAKIPFSIAGPQRYTTASEVAVLQYVRMHTQDPVPKVLAWSCDPSNPVGAEYIIMEKASGLQLFKKWGTMNEYEQFLLVRHLTQLEGELAAIRFPASGSLYLRTSLLDSDVYKALDRDMDPSEQFCIGPSCERGWVAKGEMASFQSRPDRGPWPNLSSFGIALIEREIARLENGSTTTAPGPPRGSINEQVAVLKMARDVMFRLDSQTLIDKVSRPVLWHTVLHMGNVYVSNEDPTRIISLIDWQSIVVSPLCLQARFPEFLSVDEDYALGSEVPKLPPNYHEMDADDQEIADFKLREAKLAKAYEFSTGSKNNQAYKALFIPSFLRELFVRCGEASEEGVAPLRACLIQLSEVWNEVGFTDECPFGFSDEVVKKHEQEFKEYRDFHRIQELAREYLDTDSEGWISPQLDFGMKEQQNKDLLRLIMSRSADYNMTPEGIQRIWPFPESR